MVSMSGRARGEVSDAVFVVNGSEILGLIYTVNGTFQILPVSLSVHEIYALDISLFPSLGISGVLAGDGLRAASSSSFDPGTISQLESAYFGWLEYDDSNNGLGDIVTIDVFVVITDKAISDSELNSDHSLALLAVEVANRAYASNNLPIRLHLANYDNAERYADAGSIDQDLKNLLDPNENIFDQTREEIKTSNADVVVMMVGDYKISDNEGDVKDKDLKNKCGMVPIHLAESAGDAYGVVESVCIAAHSFTGVIGRM